jgi:PhzF family phenazine biosynthesis protein
MQRYTDAMAYAFRIMNVFTVGNDRLSGNPLCVFEDARGLTDAQMQALARQMNLSETTFVLPPSGDADARVRIFTPSYEMPFAGHPTLGTASVVGALRGVTKLTFEMKAGRVPVAFDGTRWTLETAKAPQTRAVDASRMELARMVGLPDDAVSDTPLWVDTGTEQLVIPIRSSALVRAAKPVPELLARWGYTPTREEAMAYLCAEDGAGWTVRFFFTSQGAVIEDPATGSACANLGGWMLATGRPLPVKATVRQGDAVERPSQLGLEVDANRRIFVSGAVIELGQGSIRLAD